MRVPREVRLPLDNDVARLKTSLYDVFRGYATAINKASDKLRDFVSVRDFGARGDGVTDDTEAIRAAVAASIFVDFPAGVYCISDAISLKTGGCYRGRGENSVIRAVAGFPALTAMFVDESAGSGLVIRDIRINADNQAAHGVRTTQTNTNSFVLDNVTVLNATSHGFHITKAIEASFYSVRADHCGGDGMLIEDANGAALLNCRFVSNGGNGLTVQKGVNAFSSGVRVIGGQYESNTDRGIFIRDASSVTVVTGAWIEANGNDGIQVGSGAGYVPVQIDANNIFILANGGATNWGVNLASGARGRVVGNHLFNSGGLRNFVYDGSDGGVDTSGNVNGNAGETRETKLPSGSAVILHSTDYSYEAVKFWTGPGETTTWTPVLTAKDRSSIEVEISGADDSGSTAGTFIVKTWTTKNAATRVSFAEIGGGTNPKTAGSYFFPVGTDAEAPNVRWNGDNLEIKQGSAGSNKMTIRARASTFGAAYKPTWLV